MVPEFASRTATTTPLTESFLILLSENGFDEDKNGLVVGVWASPVNGLAVNGFLGLVGEVVSNGKDKKLDVLSVGLLSGDNITLCSNLPHSPNEKCVTVTGVAHLLRSSLDTAAADSVTECSSVDSLISSGAAMPPFKDKVNLSPPLINDTKQ